MSEVITGVTDEARRVVALAEADPEHNNCYLCPNRWEWAVGQDGAEHAAWPCCDEHLTHLVGTARRWVESGLNETVTVKARGA